MPFRLKKFVGTIVMVVWVVVYAFFAAAVGDTAFGDKSGWAQAAYFLVAGLAWLPVAMAIIGLFFREKPQT